MTEEEAKTKWCPFARQDTRGGVTSYGGEGSSTYPVKCMCIASACMAWRWEFKKADGTGTIGFCGLAGRE